MARPVLLFEMDRALVVRAAEFAIAETRRQGLVLSRGLVRRLLRVARTAPEFALGEWFVDRRCGCLIGNLYGQPVVVDELPEAEYYVGLEFDSALADRLSEGDRVKWLLNRAALRDMVVRVREAA